MSHATAIDISHARTRIDDIGPRWALVAGLVGVAGLAASVVFGFVDGWEVFFRSYVLNLAYAVSLALGALFFVILQHLTRAGWSVVVRRLAECIAATLPLLALLAVPIVVPVLAGMKEVYPWSNHEEVAHDHLLQWKQPFLNAPFFIIRLTVYFIAWSLLARYFYCRSIAQDTSGDPDLTTRMQRLSGIGMVIYGLTVTFFSIDLIMSMTPHWYSTIYGVYYFSGSAVGFFALLALTMVLLQSAGRARNVITVEHYHDIGKLVFGFVVFWAYIAFSQYMLIWYANLPEETSWYYARQSSQWWVGVALVLLFGHFVAPFLALISRRPKRRTRPLALAAVWILIVHWIDIYYLVIPQAHHFHGEEHAAGSPLHVSDITLLIGLGGLFVCAVLRLMSRSELLPIRDPRLSESLTFENV
ncbi:MAG: quinol:cytochrome C oxidoreductase [Phycisphaerae bacterium]|nr:quinol:cytochrome C oxidoreductase [Phycisphaerae bacterium]